MEQRRSLIRLQSGFGFFGFQIQWILFQKGFIRSKIRFWIHRKNTPKVVTRLKLFSQKGRPGLKCFLLHRSWQKQPELLETDFQTESNLGNMLLAFYVIAPIVNFNLKSPGFSEDGKSFSQWKTHKIYGHIYHGLSLHVHVMS